MNTAIERTFSFKANRQSKYSVCCQPIPKLFRPCPCSGGLDEGLFWTAWAVQICNVSEIFTYLCIKYIYILNACTNLSPFTPTESRAGVGPPISVGINRVQRSFVYIIKKSPEIQLKSLSNIIRDHGRPITTTIVAIRFLGTINHIILFSPHLPSM